MRECDPLARYFQEATMSGMCGQSTQNQACGDRIHGIRLVWSERRCAIKVSGGFGLHICMWGI
jgi:hypothetical protein